MPLDVEYLCSLDVEAFDADRHDRSDFSCGNEKLDNFLKITASRYVREGDGRIYVAVERMSGRLIGYYAVGPHAIDISALDEKARKHLPRGRDRISAFILSMMAVDETVQGRGVASFLLGHLFTRCLAAADIVGGRFLVLDAIDERAATTHQRMGFESLASQPGRMLISIAKLRRNAIEADRG